jgi:MoxR-like ATPase
MVLATQNPIEMEGTYPLPEAQLDRFFFKILIPSPDKEALVEVLKRTTSEEEAMARPVLAGGDVLAMRRLARQVPIASHVMDYAARLVLATHPASEHAPEKVRRYIRYGASPRAGQALVLAGKIIALVDGRYNVSLGDIRWAAHPALRHRLILNFEGEAEGLSTDDIISELLSTLPQYPREIQRMIS